MCHTNINNCITNTTTTTTAATTTTNTIIIIIIIIHPNNNGNNAINETTTAAHQHPSVLCIHTMLGGDPSVSSGTSYRDMTTISPTKVVLNQNLGRKK